jgi:C4-type Zn-finger protein
LDGIGKCAKIRPLNTHIQSMQCPICKGMCKYVKLNSLVPYEEIEAEIKERRVKAEDQESPRNF